MKIKNKNLKIIRFRLAVDLFELMYRLNINATIFILDISTLERDMAAYAFITMECSPELFIQA